MDRYSEGGHSWSHDMHDAVIDNYGDKPSDGEVYSDGEFDEDYTRSDKRHRRSSPSSKRDDKSKDGNKERDQSKSTRRDRSKDRKDHESSKYRERREKSSDRKRSRSRDRERRSRKHKRRSKHRRHSSSDSRSSSRSGGRSRRRRSRSYDSYGSSSDSRDYYSDYNNDKGYERTNDSYKYQEPNSTVMVRGMASHLTEQDIRADLLKCGMNPKDIRLIRHRETGASRGFAFVEFHTVQEATRWMEMKMGSLILQDEYHTTLIYSVPKVPVHDKTKSILSDWYCSKCQAHNFKRRETCYKCHSARPEDQDPELAEEFSSHPTSTLILYNLDALTTEESILHALRSNPVLAAIPIRNVRIARDVATRVSRGLCYVDTNTVAEAVRIHGYLTKEFLTVDGRQVTVAYAKSHAQGITTSSVAATALAAAQWTNSTKPITDQDAIERMAQYSASLYAKTPEEHVKYLSYYRDYFQKNPSEINLNNIQPSKAADPSPATPAASMVLVSSGANSEAGDTDKSSTGSSTKVPDVSRYQYDDASGYYYDPVTGYYYDASSQYFYGPTKQQYLYWNIELSDYLPVADNASGVSSNDIKAGLEKKKDKKIDKQDKVKVAKKIAKDMEKWAKTLNQKKDYVMKAGLGGNDSASMPLVSSTSSASNDAILLTEERPPLQLPFNFKIDASVTKSQPSTSKSQLVAHYGDESDSDEDNPRLPAPPVAAFNPDAMVDFSKLACLLCKRQFPSKEVLIKHTKLSDLHRKNLEEASLKTATSSTQNYRDRAKERRMKFGSEPVEGKSSLKDMYMQARKEAQKYAEEHTKSGIKDDNIGNRMLQKMGWQEGQGLGRGNQGRTEIITAERRAPNVGLGHRAFAPVDEDEDRQYRARKLTLARYQELE